MEVLHKQPNKYVFGCKSIEKTMKTTSFKIEHAKSMGAVEKVSKLVVKTDGFLMWFLTTLQVWTPEATISSYFG